MRDIYISPIKAVLDFLSNSTMDLILCTSEDYLPKPLPSNVLRLDFWDTVDVDDPAAFSAQLAAEVASFLRRPDARSKLFVCCDCGVSRSAALAAAIRCASGGSDLPIWHDPNYMPNPLVYRLMRQALDAPITEDALNARLALNATSRREAFSRSTAQTDAAEAKEDCYAKWVQEDLRKAEHNGGIATTYPVDLGKYCWQVGNIFVFFDPYSPADKPRNCLPIGRLHPDERRLELISPGHVDKIQKKDFDFVYIPATESRIPENIFEPGIIIETPIWSYARYYAEQHGIPVHAYLCNDEDFVPYGEYKSIKDVLEKQTFQCVKKIKLIPGQSCFETDEFLDLCSNVDEYCIVDSDDECPLCVKDGVLYYRSGLELYRVPPKMEGVFAVPSGVDALRMHAFFRSALTQITLPNTLCTIDELAFEDCPNLESLSFPASVTCIGDQPDWDSPVADCPKLQSITVDPANPKYFSIDGVLYSKENDYLLAYPSGKSGPFDTPSFVRGCASYSFLGCRALTSIHLGTNVTQIGSYAFADCTSLTELHLHAKIKELDLFSLAGCTSLKDIYIDNLSLNIIFACLNITSTDDASVIRSAREKFLPTIGQGQLVVHAPKGSTAAKFAEQCGLKFAPVLG